MRTRLLTTTLLVTAMLPLAGALAFAQDTAAPEVAPAPEAVVAPVPEAAPAPEVVPAPVPEAVPPAAPAPAVEPEPAPAPDVAAAAKSKDTLSVDFPDEEIRSVLRNVADLFELNLVIPDTLQGKTTIKLRDVTWRQIFQVVLQPVGYTFVEDGNIIKIVTQESLNLEPLATEVFILNYAKAMEVKPSLDSLVDAKVGGKIVVDARSNALVVTERPSAFQRIRPIIVSLDKATDQVMIESKFIEVTNKDIENIGVNWASLSSYGVGVGDIEHTYASTGSRTSTATSTVVQPGVGTGTSTTDTFVNDVGRMTSAVFSADKFSLLLSALTTQNDSKLVSNPTVVTLNNTEATINMGDEIPIPNFTYNQEQGVFEISGFTYKPVGVLLKVTPQVNSTGFIKLAVEPEVSSTDETKDKKFGTAVLPVITTRKAKTQVTMKDGYTLAIGGMIQKTDSKGQSKVPVLGSIPGLGRLFRSDSKSTQATNLVIFLTAKTIKPDGGDVTEVIDPRLTRQMEIEKSDLPGYRDGSDPFFTPPPPEPKKKSWFSK